MTALVHWKFTCEEETFEYFIKKKFSEVWHNILAQCEHLINIS